MSTEHRNIADAQRHEPKGASTATLNQIQKSNGDGSTSWVNASTIPHVSIQSTLEAQSLVSQGPTTTDTVHQVTWGDATANSHVNVAANGTVTFLSSGLYMVTFNLNMGRASNTGIAILLARLLVNDTATGFVQVAKIDTSANINAFNALITRPFAVNDTLKVQLIRDSAGANDGGLITIDPVIADWNNSPSAAIRFQKILGGF